jgi:hypothetical protein
VANTFTALQTFNAGISAYGATFGNGPVTIAGNTVWHAGNDGATSALDAGLLYGISGSIYASSLATGLLYGGVVSVNAGNTATFDITGGRGQIHYAGAGYTGGPSPTLTLVTWPAQTGVTLANLATADTTWLYYDSSGVLHQQTTYYTDDQIENNIIVGALVHPTRSYITLARTIPNVGYATDKQYEQFIRGFGPLKVSGHTISANGANLKLNRAQGTSFMLGRNYINDPNNPSVVSDNAQTDCTFYRYYRNGSGGFTTVINQTAIDPTKYDNGTGTLATVPGGKYTIQRLFFFPNTPTVLGVYYGRNTYVSLTEASANINLEDFTEIENTRTNAIFVGYLIVKSGATDLSNTSDALLIQAGGFRSTSSGGGSVTLTLDGLSDVIITGAANDDVLRYVDGTTGWENTPISSLAVTSYNGRVGAVQGVSAAVAGTGISVSGATGSVTFTNTGVLSWNGLTGAVTGVTSSGSYSWPATQYFNSIEPYDATNILISTETSNTIVSIGDINVQGNGTFIQIDDQTPQILIGGAISSNGSITTTSSIAATDFSDTYSIIQTYRTTTTSTTANQTIATIGGVYDNSQIPAVMGYPAFDVTISARDTVANKTEMLKMHIVQDGTNTVNTQYGLIRTGATGPVSSYSTTLDSDTPKGLLIRATPASTNNTVFTTTVRQYI